MKTKSYQLFIIIISLLLIISCSKRNDGLSDDSFAISPIDESQLKIFSPVDGESLEPGATLKIRWSFPGNINTIQLTLYRKSEFKEWLSVKTKNSGYYEWKIPADFKNSVHYRVKISVYDEPTITKFSEYFHILTR